MKKKADKQKDLDKLKQELAKAENLFVTGYEKITVAQDNDLRKVVRDTGAK